MKNVQEWVNDKPVLLALNSLEWVYLAPEIYKYLCSLSEEEKENKIKEKFPLPAINEWIAMYENPSVISTLIGILANMNQLMGMLVCLCVPNEKDANIMEIKKQALKTPNELKANDKTKDIKDNYWLKLNKARLDSMDAEISDIDDDIKDKFQDLLKSPIFIYTVRVLIPSILLYQRNPQDLFREAKNGKLDSLAKLLVIDKEILRDEIIFGLYKAAAQKNSKVDYNMLTKAFKQTPADQLSLKKVKIAVARFILDISNLMGHHFSTNEIRDLYDKIEKDRQSDDGAIDEDGTYDSADSFYRAVVKRHPGYDFLLPKVSDKIF
ncbi:hypothetical protein ER57_02010 [Smithella sp. SCADC]|jgi:hypothetical protein|nr:hypothetical protein ER57_02010 [Smithella sp. SCADC]HAR49047.1 hypothetical protein [Smithella sp.]